MNIYSSVTAIKGVGPKMAEKLGQCGIYSVLDLLLYFPRDYESIFIVDELNDINGKEKVILEVEVERILPDIRTKTRKVMTTIRFSHKGVAVKGLWFNQPYVKTGFRVGSKYVISGTLEKQGREFVIMNAIIMRNTTAESSDIMAKYPLKEDISNTFINKIVTEVLNLVTIEENLPRWIVEEQSFISLNDAIRNIHNPKSLRMLDEARRRLKFQELFTYSLKLIALKNRNLSSKGISFKISQELKKFKEKLPFELTEAQTRTVREILRDQKASAPMNRLVQGDVGSGKTIVALIALFNVVKNGYQGAMMAPTEILAKQHFYEAEKLYKDFNIKVELLTGSTTEKNKGLIKERLANGEIDILIGTHALIEDNVVFNNLGLIITDEQHRFGVGQRTRLGNKREDIDVLVMSATPIPRTLCLYMYGDLDVSIIDTLPPGRKPIDTYYLSKEEKSRVYNFALQEIAKGRQVYVVCPLVEENEDLKLSSVESLYEELKKSYFKSVEIAILHGKMSNKDKNFIMGEFKAGKIKVLISTTVIEVGVNVPNATMMIIENAERFGLSQLHQLRGRVGRGDFKSYCVLVANIKSETTKRRMEIMKKSSDGFYIAEQDLQLRGSGEMFGMRQSGDNGLILSDLSEDFQLFKLANIEAKKFFDKKDDENQRILKEIIMNLERSTKYICFN
ncbi:MAG: ATP-dependent DNA helicase RecG [Clostridium sp.]|nr:ATP-dependent DNA helicase RecG [Clostridium sp.]MDU7083278.1 ATP-dependent DNA helicase RecG [Clostridium sp.]